MSRGEIAVLPHQPLHLKQFNRLECVSFRDSLMKCLGIQGLNIWCTALLRRALHFLANPMLLMFIVLQRKCKWDPSAGLVALIISNHRPRIHISPTNPL